MSDCRICQNSVSRYQTFCSKCGARQRVDTTEVDIRQGVFARLKSFLKELFRSEAEREAERHLQAGFNLGQYGFEAAIPDHEEAVRLNPSHKSVLATTYLGAGDERLSHPGGFPGGPLGELVSFSKISAERKAEEILSWVSKVRQSEEGYAFQLIEAGKGLDEALDGALAMYDSSVRLDRANPHAYSGRARAFHKVADGILMAYSIFPLRSLRRSANERDGKPVQYGNARLGICIRQEMPDLKLGAEIVWLYGHAEEDYKEALRLDSTDTKSCVELSHVLGQLGKRDEATDYFDRALAILNKAILVDNDDERSYCERAEIFEELGEIELAISDLERVLTLSTWEFKLDGTRRKIGELRRSKEAGEKE